MTTLLPIFSVNTLLNNYYIFNFLFFLLFFMYKFWKDKVLQQICNKAKYQQWKGVWGERGCTLTAEGELTGHRTGHSKTRLTSSPRKSRNLGTNLKYLPWRWFTHMFKYCFQTWGVLDSSRIELPFLNSPCSDFTRWLNDRCSGVSDRSGVPSSLLSADGSGTELSRS